MTPKPIAVVISDIHFNNHTVRIAARVLTMALQWAEKLVVPLIIAGDLNDTKAIIRAEVANELVAILSKAEVPVYIMEGNHDKVNEKGKDHGLNYLRPYAKIVDATMSGAEISPDLVFLPYHNSIESLRESISLIKPGSLVIAHQGVKGAHMGDYVVDKTSIAPGELARFAVISGHYHRHQTIVTDDKKHDVDYGIGTFTFIGSPYTITAGEANDPDKGFLILNSDRSFSRVLTNQRKHVILERDIANVMDPCERLNSCDLLWLKVRGPYSELEKLSKKEIGMRLLGHQNFNLERVYTELEQVTSPIEKLTDEEIFDLVIEQSDEAKEQKAFLKSLWREVTANATG